MEEPRIICRPLSEKEYELADFGDGECFVYSSENEYGEWVKRYLMCINDADITQTPYTNLRYCIDLETGETEWVFDTYKAMPMAFDITGLGE